MLQMADLMSTKETRGGDLRCRSRAGARYPHQTLARLRRPRSRAKVIPVLDRMHGDATIQQRLPAPVLPGLTAQARPACEGTSRSFRFAAAPKAECHPAR